MKKFFLFFLFVSLAFSKGLYIKNVGKISYCSLPDDEVVKVYNTTISIKDLKPYLNLAKNLNEKNVKSVILGAILDKLLEIKLKNNKQIDIAYYLFEKSGPKIALDYLSKNAKIKRKGNMCLILYNSTLSTLENAKMTLENINNFLANPVKFCKKANLPLDECEKQVEVWKDLKKQLTLSIKPILFRYKTLISKIYVTKKQFLYNLFYLFKDLDLENTKSIVATYRMYDVPILLLQYKNGKFVDILTNRPVSEKAIYKAYIIKGYKYPVKFYKIKNYLKRTKQPFVALLYIPKFSKLTFDVCNLIALRKINWYAAKLLRENRKSICIDPKKLDKIKEYLK